ncbi:MAG: nucleoside hydrolase [Jiangellaceae bacterium]
MPVRVVLVVDTGVDDALALMVAARHPDLDLCGVICTGGNVPLRRVLANTVHVLGVLGVAAPVASGADRRLDGTPFAVRAEHGSDGLAGLAPPSPDLAKTWPPPGAVASRDAVTVSLGPLTSLVGLVTGRVVASYARTGEANHGLDPVAAGVIASSGRVVDHVDAGDGVLAGDVAGPLSRVDDRLCRLAGGLLAHQARRGAGLGDAAALLRVAEPELDRGRHTQRFVGLLLGED